MIDLCQRRGCRISATLNNSSVSPPSPSPPNRHRSILSLPLSPQPPLVRRLRRKSSLSSRSGACTLSPPLQQHPLPSRRIEEGLWRRRKREFYTGRLVFLCDCVSILVCAARGFFHARLGGDGVGVEHAVYAFMLGFVDCFRWQEGSSLGDDQLAGGAHRGCELIDDVEEELAAYRLSVDYTYHLHLHTRFPADQSRNPIRDCLATKFLQPDCSLHLPPPPQPHLQPEIRHIELLERELPRHRLDRGARQDVKL